MLSSASELVERDDLAGIVLTRNIACAMFLGNR